MSRDRITARGLSKGLKSILSKSIFFKKTTLGSLNFEFFALLLLKYVFKCLKNANEWTYPSAIAASRGEKHRLFGRSFLCLTHAEPLRVCALSVRKYTDVQTTSSPCKNWSNQMHAF